MGESLVKISDDQQVTADDLNNIGAYAQESLDHVVADGIDESKKFAGFTVTAAGVASVIVADGRLYNGGAVYKREDGGVAIDLITLLPAIAQKYVTIIGYGTTRATAVEPRTFLVDVDTEETEAKAVSTETQRYCNLDKISGVEAATPTVPALNSEYLAIAHVLLDPTGIVSITMVAENALDSVSDVAARTKTLETWKSRTGARLDVYDASLAGLQTKVRGTPSAAVVVAIAGDVARLKEQAEIPETYTYYDADRFLTTDKSDTGNVDWLARVEEGAHFADAAVQMGQLLLLNADDATVDVTDNFLLPAYEDEERERIVGNDSEVAISQYAYQTQTAVELSRTRTRIRYGATKTVCTNHSWWQSGTYDSASKTFTRNGETFEVLERFREHTHNHISYRIRQYWVDTYEESYWEYVTEETSVSASYMGETFLNSDPGYITAVGLYFTNVGATGDVTVMVTETENGAPMLDRVLAKSTLAVGDIAGVYPMITKVPIPPTYLEKGTRYAVVIATPGNHFLSIVGGNTNTAGSMFYSTDGAWSQVDLVNDLAYSLYYAKFSTPRLTVSLEPLTLENGIADIDLLFDSSLPDSTELSFEIKVNGEWKPLKYYDTNILNGLPALLQLRAVLVGTVNVMPGFGLAALSQTKTSRPGASMTHISTAHDLPASCTQIVVNMRLEAWDDARHTAAITLLTGASYDVEETADTVVDTATPDADSIVRTATFNLGAAIDTYKIKTVGTTDNVLVTYHVAERYDVAFA
ncbi:hypothetical protein [Breoghania sp.]|uniref:hypothetical protein n=1 Tax=Breoghania sp. TaxID=2065378 RepID=UPI002AA8B2AB|nr:hypothetical protein [Breoghania sp.]